MYARVSSAEQAEGYSIDGQLEQMRNYAGAHGYSVFEEYLDPGFDSGTSNRPGLTRLLNDAFQDNFDVVLVYRYDRLYRETRLFLDLEYELRQHDVKVVSVTEPIDDTHEGRFQLLIKASFAEYEKAVIRQRANMGRLRAVREGKWLGGQAPYGYDLDQRTTELVVNGIEAEWVRKFFSWLVEDKLTLHALQNRANDMKAPTKSETLGRPDRHRVNRPGFWMQRTLGRIVTRELYTGTFRYGRNGRLRKANLVPPEGIAVAVPKIIDEELFRRAQEQLRSNSALAPRRLKRKYLLRGLLRCGACGRAWMGSANSQGNRYYRCIGKQNWTSSERCPMSSISARNLEPVVWSEIAKLLDDPVFVLGEIEKREGDLPRRKEAELGDIVRQTERTHAEAERIFVAYRAGAISLGKLQGEQEKQSARAAQLESQRRRLVRELEGWSSRQAREAALIKLSKQVRGSLHRLSYDERCGVVQNLVEKVIVTHRRGVEILTVVPLDRDKVSQEDDRQVDGSAKQLKARSVNSGVLLLTLYAPLPPKWQRRAA